MKRICLSLVLLLLFASVPVYAASSIKYLEVDTPDISVNKVGGWVHYTDFSRGKDFSYADLVMDLDEINHFRQNIIDITRNSLRSEFYVEYDEHASTHEKVYVWAVKPNEDDPSIDFIRKNLLNAILVENGYARVQIRDSKYNKELLLLQAEAKENHKGIWQ